VIQLTNTDMSMIHVCVNNTWWWVMYHIIRYNDWWDRDEHKSD